MDTVTHSIGATHIEGRDGYLFLSAGGHFILDYLTGLRTPSEESVTTFWTNVSARDALSRQAGADYSLWIFADKLAVMRDWVPMGGEIRSLFERCYLPFASGTAYRYLGNVLDPATAFLRNDTHLAHAGLMDVAEAIATRHGIATEDFFRKFSHGLRAAVGPMNDLGVKCVPRRNEPVILADRVMKAVRAHNGMPSANDGMICLSVSREAVTQKRLLIFGDSFFRQLLPYLEFFFGEIIFCRTRYVHREMIEMFKPDIVMSGLAERYLSSVSPDHLAPDFLDYPRIKNVTPEPTAAFSGLWKRLSKDNSAY